MSLMAFVSYVMLRDCERGGDSFIIIDFLYSIIYLFLGMNDTDSLTLIPGNLQLITCSIPDPLIR